MLAGATLALPACSQQAFFSDRPYHHALQEQHQASTRRDLLPCVQHDPRGFDLAFVEFDQQGDFWDRNQLRDASNAIKGAARQGNILLVEYVHGWHNNAKEFDPKRDVESFKLLLDTLARAPYVKNQNYRVFGAYIGWRGEMVRETSNPLSKPLWLPHTLSFYPEKHIGSTVGAMPMATEAIFWLVHEARHNSKAARTILIGHSFGAMVLENAIAQAVASSVAGTPYEGRNANTATIYAPADLVLLINSANDSMRTKGLEEMLFRMGSSAHYINRDRPLIVSVSSDADWPNITFFPIGTGLSNAFRHFRDYTMFNKTALFPPENQRHFLTTTPEHNPYLLSHQMTIDDLDQFASAKPLDQLDPAERANFQRVFDENLAAPKQAQGVGPSRAWHFLSVSKNGGDCNCAITPMANAKNTTPYWVLHVPNSVIKDHGDIFNQQTLCLYAAIFRIDSPKGESRIPPGPRLLQVSP